jgi:hypothetical protein
MKMDVSGGETLALDLDHCHTGTNTQTHQRRHHANGPGYDNRTQPISVEYRAWPKRISWSAKVPQQTQKFLTNIATWNQSLTHTGPSNV